ncbi:HAD hydrolase family protein [Paenibacillus rigui]|uniref:Haloacid dehalogenase n=1 Tax=Paenibacillus rigui TaxID=554312 RepID=A0A229UX42_9BACL|nr:HAD hydrolase family protein [Paenibacillus rigui]OXM88004.1 haloacid dehalogenase [Paenibacillus rigui]
MNPIYVLTDLDGTLLHPDATLSKLSREVVTDAIRDGHVISYATARSYISSHAVAGEIHWRHPVVLYNGALLFDPVAKVKLDGAFLNTGITNQLIAFGKSFGLCPLLFALDHRDAERVLHEPLRRSGDQQFRASRPGDPRFQELDELQCPDDFQTLILTYIGHFEELKPLYEAVKGKHADQVHIHMMPDGYLQDHYFLELSHPEANKRHGLRMWAKQVGCEPEQIIVFGDNLNDIGLFEAGGTKIAVGNAQPGLKAMADRIIEANSEDGVARYLQEVLEGVKETG